MQIGSNTRLLRITWIKLAVHTKTCALVWRILGRLIGLTRTSLKKVLGHLQVDMKTLVRVISEIESILNDRRLTYLSSDITYGDVLTTAHLLYSRRITTLLYPQINIDETSYPTVVNNSDLNKRARNQIIMSLREFHRTTGNNDEAIQVGDIVQIHQESPIVNCKIGIVTYAVRGKDGLI